MMRLMGAVLVAFGAAWLGLTAAAELGRKVRRLEQLSIGLELLERELWERGSPLPQVLEELSLRTGELASTLFAQCAAACGRLDRERERAEGEKLRMGRVYQALGLSGGAFLVILLL